MGDLRSFPGTLRHKANLLAVDLQPRQGSVRLRLAHQEAGRVREAALSSGFARWEAIKLEDDFLEAVRLRLVQLDTLAGEAVVTRNVFSLPRRDGAAA
ncbi:hypothetical protein [Ancylobacter terrae]|uniref:hypothetical protein n=1 Tax=Ancylobacter sp. sgz301288 TaxID=3342077 RepID=UPI00385A6FDC